MQSKCRALICPRYYKRGSTIIRAVKSPHNRNETILIATVTEKFAIEIPIDLNPTTRLSRFAVRVPRLFSHRSLEASVPYARHRENACNSSGDLVGDLLFIPQAFGRFRFALISRYLVHARAFLEDFSRILFETSTGNAE